jgi:hypothetical protein
VGRERGDGRWREGKEDGKKTNQIIQKNKSIMQDAKGCKNVNSRPRNAQASPKSRNKIVWCDNFSQLSILTHQATSRVFFDSKYTFYKQNEIHFSF